jgi:hypothetical protein
MANDNEYTIDLSDITVNTDDDWYWGDDMSTVTITSGSDTITFPEVSEQYNYDLRIRQLEDLLGLPDRDYDLEAKHPHLRDMYQEQVGKVKKKLLEIDNSEYNTECEKLRAWDILNK